MVYHIIMATLCNVLVVAYCHASVVIAGNDATYAQTMTFPIGAYTFDAASEALFVGAADAIEGNQFSLAVSVHGTIFEPLALPTVMLNGILNQPNPAYGKAIACIAAASHNHQLPVFTLKDDPSTLYVIESRKTLYSADNARRQQLISMLSLAPINDANGNPGTICALTTGTVFGQACIFVAVSPAGQQFGMPGSGIALVRMTDSMVRKGVPALLDEHGALLMEEKETTQTQLVLHDAITGEPHGNRAVALDCSIGAPLAQFAPTFDMYWDGRLKRLFIATQGRSANTSSTDGMHALMIGRVEKRKNTFALTFSPAVDTAAVADTRALVSVKGAAQAISLYKVRTLHTSTGLHYVVVAGGTGAVTEVGNTLYALPLIEYVQEARYNGLLAHAHSIPVTHFRGNYPFTFAHRGFTERPETVQHLVSSESTPAVVGGGTVPLEPDQQITSLFTHADAVYVTVAGAYNGITQPGMFFSQALFDQYGRIAAWTPWARIGGTDAPLAGGGINSTRGFIWLMPVDEHGTLTTVRHTQWGRGEQNGLLGGTRDAAANGFVAVVSQELPEEQGGVLGLFDFDYATPGFSTDSAHVHHQLSLQVLTGKNKVLLIETGCNEQPGSCIPHKGDFASYIQRCTEGTLAGLVTDQYTRALAISGGVLNQLGCITAAEVSRVSLVDGTARGWLFVGGTGGLAVLARPDGSGWDTSSNAGLRASFHGLTADMSFQLIGAYKQVRKLVADGTYLYVLTATALDRIPLDNLHGPATTLATAAHLAHSIYASLSDVVVSDDYALLATSHGLYAADIDTAAPVWRAIPLPEGVSGVTRLFCVTPTGHEQGFSYNGNVYVLNAQVSTGITRAYRFVVSRSAGKVEIQQLPDMFIKDVPSYFVSYRTYRNFMGTAGGFTYPSRSKNPQDALFLQLLFSTQTGFRSPESALFAKRLVISPAGSTARLMQRSSASGTLLFPGDFGVMVYE